MVGVRRAALLPRSGPSSFVCDVLRDRGAQSARGACQFLNARSVPVTVQNGCPGKLPLVWLGGVVRKRAELMLEKTLGIEPQEDDTLGFAGLRPGGPFRRAGVDDGRQALGEEHLMPVDVATEYGRDVPR
jgi:hypothetical protein